MYNTIQYLGRDVVGRAADRALLLLADPRGQSEVSDLDSHAGGEEEVAQLEVAVEDVLPVDVVHAVDQLGHVVADLGLRHNLGVEQVGLNSVGLE